MGPLISTSICKCSDAGRQLLGVPVCVFLQNQASSVSFLLVLALENAGRAVILTPTFVMVLLSLSIEVLLGCQLKFAFLWYWYQAVLLVPVRMELPNQRSRQAG